LNELLSGRGADYLNKNGSHKGVVNLVVVVVVELVVDLTSSRDPTTGEQLPPHFLVPLDGFLQQGCSRASKFLIVPLEIFANSATRANAGTLERLQALPGS